MTDVLLVICTFPNEGEARQIGTHLVERQYAACVSFIPRVESIYQWEGKLCQEAEVMALIKTTREGFSVLSRELLAMHSYDEPELVAVPVADGSAGYLAWVLGQVRAG